MNDHYPFINPPLPYAYDTLEPFIDKKTMELHHDRHLKTYVDNLNHILKDYPEYQGLSLTQLLLYPDILPASIRTAVINNAGGVYNHIFFFSTLQSPSSTQQSYALTARIDRQFGSISAFQKAFSDAALYVFGSGYAWLVRTSHGQLKIITTANQDTPLPGNMCPILTLDVWEHAYYLKHYNKRADYISNWFYVINWEQADKNYSLCRA